MQASTTKTQAAWCARLVLLREISRNQPNNGCLYTLNIRASMHEQLLAQTPGKTNLMHIRWMNKKRKNKKKQWQASNCSNKTNEPLAMEPIWCKLIQPKHKQLGVLGCFYKGRFEEIGQTTDFYIRSSKANEHLAIEPNNVTMQANTSQTQAAWCARLVLQGEWRKQPNSIFLFTFSRRERCPSSY